MTTTITETVLPASLVKAPTTEYSVSSYKSMDLGDGVAASGNIKRGNKVVGHVEDRGDGGMLWISFNSAEESKLFDEYVALWTWTWGEEWNAEYNYDRESVANELMFEAEVKADLNRVSRTKTVVMNTPITHDGALNLGTYNYKVKPTDTIESLTKLLRLSPGDRVWNKTNWLFV